MATVFADTFYWIALLNRGDSYHSRATSLKLDSSTRIVTTMWVLTETADALSPRKLRGPVAGFIRSLLSDPSVAVLPFDQQLFDRGLERFDRRHDKDWSLTDCISFVTMEEQNISESLTGDQHFEQAGFVALLK